MIFSDSTSSFVNYYKRHGFAATSRRTVLYLQRLFLFPRMVLFYCDLTSPSFITATKNELSDVSVERKTRENDIDPQDLQRIVNFWNPKVFRRHLPERFQRGASLWLIRSAGQLAGYGWTLKGGTIEPHYFMLGSNDVHFFDFLVFPEYRGRKLNPALVGEILRQMAAENRSRAYIECAEWNQPQLNSLKKTGFQLLGVARKKHLLGQTFVRWENPELQLETRQTAVSAKADR
jgi:RimJ/RimL family protein N-acetyltransferase